MGTMDMQRGIFLPRSEPAYGADDQDRIEPVIEPAPADMATLIGQWYYYIYNHGDRVHLCRTKGDTGLPVQAEMVRPGYLAISDDDLECAVRHQSDGTFESGCYGISPLIERKLRILFE